MARSARSVTKPSSRLSANRVSFLATSMVQVWKTSSSPIDFLAVDEKKPVAIEVPLNLFGHPVGVQAGGKFTQLARKVRISALLENLPDQLDVDITPLGLDKRLTVGELKFDGINILSDKNTIICRVKTTRAMQQAAADAAKDA